MTTGEVVLLTVLVCWLVHIILVRSALHRISILEETVIASSVTTTKVVIGALRAKYQFKESDDEIHALIFDHLKIVYQRKSW